MADALTWRDVAPPDFQGSMYGYKIAGDALSNATKTASDALEKFDVSRKNDVANAIYQASMAYQDPAALKAALADGSLYAKAGVNPALITADANKALETRASTLLGQAASQVSLDHNKVMNPLLEQQQKTANDFAIADNPIRLGQAQANLDQTKQNTSQNKTKFENDQADRAEEDAAVAAATNAARGAVTPQDAIGALDKMELDPGVRAKALAKLNGQVSLYNQGLDPAGPSSPGSGGRGGAAGAGAAIAGAVGATQTAPTASGMDDYLQITKQKESGGKANAQAGGGSSAGGLYQFTDDTWNQVAKTHPELGLTANGKMDSAQQELAVRALTADNAKVLSGASIPLTPGNLYMAHFLGAGGATHFIKAMQENPNADASALFPKAAKANPTIFNGRTLSQVYALQTKEFNGMVPGDIREQNTAQNSRVNALIANAATVNDQQNAGGIQGQYADTQSDTKMTMGDAVEQLQKKGFKDVSGDTIRQKLEQIKTESRQKGNVEVTNATAAAILDRVAGTDGRHWYSRSVFDDGFHANSDLQSQILKSIGQGDADKIKTSNSVHTAIAAAAQTAMDQKNRAYNELVQAQQAALVRPEVRSTVSDKMLAYQRASQNVERLLKQAETSGSITPSWKKPDEG